MKRKWQVILVTCLIAAAAIFLAIVWARRNVEYYASNLYGVEFTLPETVRYLFSSNEDKRVGFITLTFPLQPNTVPISESKALQVLNHASPGWENFYRGKPDGVTTVGLFHNDLESGTIVIYTENDDMVFQVLSGAGNGFKEHHFAMGFPFPRTSVLILTDGFDFGDWDIERNPADQSLNHFMQCLMPGPPIPLEDLAFYGARIFKETELQSDGVLIYYEPSTKQWKSMDWKPGLPLKNWKKLINVE